MTAGTAVKNKPAGAMADAVKDAVQVPTWGSLKTSYQQAEKSGKTAQFKAYDAVVRGFALTSEVTTDSKGTTVKASDAARSREVIDALKIVDGGVFNLGGMRISQVAKTYRAVALSGLDPFSEAGHSVFSKFDAIRKFDVNALDGVSESLSEMSGEPLKAALDTAVADAKKVAKDRAAANKAKNKANEPVVVTVKSMADVTSFVTGNLPLIREASATASDEDKAALKKALEAMLAHLS